MQGLNELLTGATGSLAHLAPELILIAGILLVLFAGLFGSRNHLLFNILTMASAMASFLYTIGGGLDTNEVLFEMLHRDGFGEFLMLLIDVSVVLSCLMSIRQRALRNTSEYYALILSVAAGSHFLVMSTNLIMVFVSLEFVSITSYVLAGYAFTRKGSEGSLKYFIFGSIASAVMLYGFTMLYGLTGTMDFSHEIFFNRLIETSSPILLVGGLMALAGFLFKMAAVPMHLWAPDIYEAAPMPVIAYLSVAPKVAALGILMKFILAMNAFGQNAFDWQLVVAAVAIITITFGNLSALWQDNPKRMMAYSSIAHTGFLLVGITAFTAEGAQLMLFYAAVYLLMNFAVFVYLMYFEKHGFFSMTSFAGQGKRLPWAAVGITIALVALTGIPPTAGFTAKLFIFSSLWESYQETHKSLLFWLLVVGLLNTVISLFFYLKIPYYAFIRSGEPATVQKNAAFENFLGFILVVLVVVIFFVPGLLMGLINRINFVL
ncbi:MAG TPA: NADH-quinone oxidoreductase subunit N [Chryseosolibacter sp.]|nr:NADH-quinone oxidoreductase subunit N [Chryseosolibacter sp.]